MNSYPYPVEFVFQTEKDSVFKFVPNRGTVSALKKTEIKIHHDFLDLPEGGGRVEESVKLKVANGVKIDMKCVSFVPECFLISKPN